MNLCLKEGTDYKKLEITSSQDGGIGRYTMPPNTTQTRTTTNIKTKNNQNCQKIELYGSPTTKELKKKHSPRPVGGVETGSRVERMQGGALQTGRSHIHVQINWEEQLGSETDHTTQGSRVGK